jgi:transcriptional regulator with XRE-family HTH domain
MTQPQARKEKTGDKKGYASVEEMVRDLSSDDDAFAGGVCREIAARNIINHLMAMRATQGLSQKDIAERMGCSQSRVSKLENGKDDDLRIGDFHCYAEALGFQLLVLLGKKGQPPIAERIRYHTSALQDLFVELEGLVRDDASMQRGMWKLVLDSLRSLALGLAGMVKGLTRKLPHARQDKPAPIRIELQKDDPAEDSDEPCSRDSGWEVPVPG